MEIDVVPLRTYLADTSLDKLLEDREKWESVKGFRASYKAEKLRRILQIIELKKEFNSSNNKA